MTNLYIMMIYMFHNYLRKNNNKIIQFQKVQKVKLDNNNGRNIVKYYVNYSQRAHRPPKKINHHCHHCLLCYLHTHLHGVSSYLQSVHKSSHSNCMGLSICQYAPCEHELHRQPLWHTQMCTPYIYNTVQC